MKVLLKQWRCIHSLSRGTRMKDHGQVAQASPCAGVPTGILPWQLMESSCPAMLMVFHLIPAVGWQPLAGSIKACLARTHAPAMMHQAAPSCLGSQGRPSYVFLVMSVSLHAGRQELIVEDAAGLVVAADGEQHEGESAQRPGGQPGGCRGRCGAAQAGSGAAHEHGVPARCVLRGHGQPGCSGRL